MIGMVGLIEDTRKIITQGFKNEGDIIALLGVTKDDLSASEYARTVLGPHDRRTDRKRPRCPSSTSSLKSRSRKLL